MCSLFGEQILLYTQSDILSIQFGDFVVLTDCVIWNNSCIPVRSAIHFWFVIVFKWWFQFGSPKRFLHCSERSIGRRDIHPHIWIVWDNCFGLNRFIERINNFVNKFILRSLLLYLWMQSRCGVLCRIDYKDLPSYLYLKTSDFNVHSLLCGYWHRLRRHCVLIGLQGNNVLWSFHIAWLSW